MIFRVKHSHRNKKTVFTVNTRTYRTKKIIGFNIITINRRLSPKRLKRNYGPTMKSVQKSIVGTA